MLLLWCLSMIQVFSYPLGESSFHLFVDLKQAIVSVSGRLSPHNFEMYSIRPYQAYSFCCWFFLQVRSILLFKDAISNSSQAELVLLGPFLYFSSRGFVRLLSSTHLLVCQDLVLFVLILLTGVLCPLLKFFSSCQVFHLLSTGVLLEFVVLCFPLF